MDISLTSLLRKGRKSFLLSDLILIFLEFLLPCHSLHTPPKLSGEVGVYNVTFFMVSLIRLPKKPFWDSEMPVNSCLSPFSSSCKLFARMLGVPASVTLPSLPSLAEWSGKSRARSSLAASGRLVRSPGPMRPGRDAVLGRETCPPW